jgi:hypothetical protein
MYEAIGQQILMLVHSFGVTNFQDVTEASKM